MKTLILYASRHGCAEKCARKLAELLGGEFNFERMTWWEKAIIRKIAKIDAGVSKIREDRISEFVEAMKA
jgi:menaquinone-dependent protoporphyrinogen IX oxidase